MPSKSVHRINEILIEISQSPLLDNENNFLIIALDLILTNVEKKNFVEELVSVMF